MNKQYIIKFGLAFTLLYAGIGSFISPSNWIGFVPSWILNFHVSTITALHIHGAAEIILGLLLLLPWKQKLVAWLVSLDFLAIIIANGFGIGVFLTTFRDIGLLTAAIYLAIV